MLFLIWLQWQRALAMDSQWELLLQHQVRIYSNVCRSACILKKHKQIHLITLYIIFTTELAKCNWPWWDSICLFLPGSDGAFWMWRLNNLTCIYSLSKKKKQGPHESLFFYLLIILYFSSNKQTIFSFFLFFFTEIASEWNNRLSSCDSPLQPSSQQEIEERRQGGKSSSTLNT